MKENGTQNRKILKPRDGDHPGLRAIKPRVGVPEKIGQVPGCERENKPDSHLRLAQEEAEKPDNRSHHGPH